MSKQGSNSELFAYENDALTPRPQLFSGDNLQNLSILEDSASSSGWPKLFEMTSHISTRYVDLNLVSM